MSKFYQWGLCLVVVAAIILACGPNPERDFERAADVLAEGHYNKAIQEYQGIVRKYNDSQVRAKALYWIANINLLYLNNTQLAIQEFENFVLEYPTHPLSLDSYWKIAITFQDEFKDRHLAILKYQKLINHFPKTAEAAKAQLAIANCYSMLGDYQQAVIEAQYLIKTYKDSSLLPKATLFIADTQFQYGDYVNAKNAYLEVIKKYPASQLVVDARFGLAATYEELQENKKALECYNKIKDKYHNPDLIKRRIKRLEEVIKREKSVEKKKR